MVGASQIRSFVSGHAVNRETLRTVPSHRRTQRGGSRGSGSGQYQYGGSPWHTATVTTARTYSDATLKELFALSGNQCAYPACRHVVIDDFGNVVAQIAHIHAVRPGAARYDQSVAEDDLRRPANLMVLCYEHHIATDDVSLYPPARMREMKRQHEGRFGGAISGLRASVQDETKGTVIRPPANLGRLYDDKTLDDADRANAILDIKGALVKLAELPPDARSVLATILERGDPTGYGESFEMTTGELRRVLAISDKELGELNNLLTRRGYIWVDPEPREGYHSSDSWISTLGTVPGSEAGTFFLEIRSAQVSLGISPTTLLVDLDWRGLDS